MAVQTDLMTAVNQIAAERNIDITEVVNAIAEAIATGFRQRFPQEANVEIKVKIKPEIGQISVVQLKTIVQSALDENSEISLVEAKKIKKDAELGAKLEYDITPQGDFGRVAAQAAKQVILQKIREAEHETQLQQFKDKIGEVEFAVVQRMSGEDVIWEVGKTIALMPLEDRIPSEYYRSGSRHKVLLKEIRSLQKGKTLIVSRADPKFLEALFALEVPELTSGSVEIKAIAREAGSRSKIAVVSHVQGIDPIGSCVGQKGVRINSIMNELRIDSREEKLDIILWDENTIAFIGNALSPADVNKVEVIDENEKVAKVYVPSEQLSLAIGKDGQNVRLAAKLTEWKLDILGSEVISEEEDQVETKKDISVPEPEVNELESLKLSTRIKNLLTKAGVTDLAGLKKYSEDYTQIPGISIKSAEEINSKLNA